MCVVGVNFLTWSFPALCFGVHDHSFFKRRKTARVVREEPRVRVKPQLVAWCSRDTHTHAHAHPLVDEHLELWKAPKNGVESGKGANGWASTLHAAKGKGRWSVTETLTTAKKNQRKAFSMILWSKNKMRQVTDATSNFSRTCSQWWFINAIFSSYFPFAF